MRKQPTCFLLIYLYVYKFFFDISFAFVIISIVCNAFRVRWSIVIGWESLVQLRQTISSLENCHSEKKKRQGKIFSRGQLIIATKTSHMTNTMQMKHYQSLAFEHNAATYTLHLVTMMHFCWAENFTMTNNKYTNLVECFWFVFQIIVLFSFVWRLALFVVLLFYWWECCLRSRKYMQLSHKIIAVHVLRTAYMNLLPLCVWIRP